MADLKLSGGPSHDVSRVRQAALASGLPNRDDVKKRLDYSVFDPGQGDETLRPPH